MKWLLAISRYVFVSLEFLVIVAGVASYSFLPSCFVWLSDRIGREVELLKYFGLLPVGLIIFNAKTVKDVLFPEADKRMILQGWPLYWNLKCGVTIGMLYGGIFAVAGIAALLFDWQTPAAHQSAFLVTSVVGAVTVSSTLYFTHIKVEEHFRQ